jgi:hypothetical protein
MILPTSYFGCIFQFAIIAQEEEYRMEAYEHFVKQSYRNRCEVYGANGKLSLTIPLKKWKNHCISKDIEISFDENWQNQHWRSIESAYRASPFFEFYEEDLKPLFFRKERFLLEYNQLLERELKEMMKLDSKMDFTNSYASTNADLRQFIDPKNSSLFTAVNYPKYMQVFEEKAGFIQNLSILDLLFNLGPKSTDYLKTIRLEKWQKR